MTRTGWAIVIILALLVGGYVAYGWAKNDPPDWLVKLVASKDPPPPLPSGDEPPLTVPQGFAATIFSRETPKARVLVREPKGALLVSLTQEGKVIALPDTDADGKADRVVTVLEKLNLPHGLAIRCPDTGNTSTDQDACVLYVAETNAVKSYAYDADTYRATYQKTLATLPTEGGGHFTRTLLPHPDGTHLLVSIGSSCNVCTETNSDRASIASINLATGIKTTFAKGLRNAVFMAVSPITGAVWATENGRDLIGDDIPPDELNIVEEGRHYGWPICYGKNIYDADFNAADKTACREPVYTPSTHDLQAHSAALGLAFIPEEGWPQDYRNDLLVAFHGSWNRSEPTGYKIVRFDMSADGKSVVGGPYDFLTGFLPRGAKEPIGRPVGLLAEPGGVLFVSDDHVGAVYRITRSE